MTEPAVMGEGRFSYLSQDWGVLPEGIVLGDVGGVAVSADDEVYVFNRSEHPMVVFDRHGRFLRSWGQGLFTRPHGLHIDAGDVWCTDDGDHTVRKCTSEGRVLLEIGLPGRPAPPMSGRPFNRCTHTATSAEGELYVSDGYGNACVHRFSADGRLIGSWGGPGIGQGEFNVPHNLCCDESGTVYVADRENHRIQRFGLEGTFQAQWPGVHRPCALCRSRGADGLFFVGEVGPALPINRDTPNLGPRISVLAADGAVIARIGNRGAGDSLAHMIAPHGIAVDSRGNLYLGEVSHAAWPSVFPGRSKPKRLRTFRKLALRELH